MLARAPRHCRGRRRRGERMPERLGLGLIPGSGWRASEAEDIPRAAEDAGFEAAFCAEVNNDAVATALLMGLATHRLKVGTWVALSISEPPISVPRPRHWPPRSPAGGRPQRRV